QLCSITPHWNESMEAHSTLKAGGRAEALVNVSTKKELSTLLRWLTNNSISHRIIGRGSNILVSEKGLAGVTIKLRGEFNSISNPEPLRNNKSNKKYALKVGAGCSLSRLLNHCTRNELGGSEFLVGIPGSLGGGVYMNAGACGKSISEIIEWVDIIDIHGDINRLSGHQLHFSYRNSIFQEQSMNACIILFVGLNLIKIPAQDIQNTCRQYLSQRVGKQPSALGSAGSFFKNPIGDSAGRLIEAAGLKGHYRGYAMVSPVHANFIVNTGQASADDISKLMTEVQQRVFDHSGVLLEPEVRFLT
ncbi:MAG: UDP-N-acetylmuramate dehydrogenase, partial [Desulfobulbaceae bacterium]|nr:UDP-N-acetylmuramate dehydrogenase [Desulfobulbaceae bacterium]